MRVSDRPDAVADRPDGPRVLRLDDGFVAGTTDDRDDLAALIATDPIVNAVLDARLSSIRSLAPRRFGGTTYGVRSDDGGLVAAAYAGGNLMPVGGAPEHWHALAGELARRRRVCTSVVGRAETVLAMWPRLSRGWGAERALRHDQPLLFLDSAPAVAPDPAVRVVSSSEAARYLPAATAMFTEELGISPDAGGQGPAYRQRIHRLVAGSRALAVFDDDGEVVFKADLGAITAHTCQVQGVWVRPDHRGRGLGTGAMAAVLAHGLTLAPSVSLYVNDFNVAARRMYDTLGMRRIASLATVLF